MNRRQHAALARQLIAACGGLREAASQCRLKRSRLQECADPLAAGYLPVDVVNDLELYCGDALYSRALTEDRPSARAASADLVDDACETAEEASDLQRAVRLLAKKGELTPREKQDVLKGALQLRGTLDRVIGDVDGDD